jgi:hypothetical protein
VKFFFFVSCSCHIVIYYTKSYYTKVVYFSKSYYPTLWYDPILSGANVDSISQVLSCAMLVLPKVAGVAQSV